MRRKQNIFAKGAGQRVAKEPVRANHRRVLNLPKFVQNEIAKWAVPIKASDVSID